MTEKEYKTFVSQTKGRQRVESLFQRVFKTEDGKKVLRYLYARYVDTVSYDASEPSGEKAVHLMLKNEGKREMIYEINDLVKARFDKIPTMEDIYKTMEVEDNE